jgi:HEPN domain-containing protein
MENENFASEWYQFAKMDYQTAVYLYDTMYPMPYEIVCYHCQQATEKLLKGLLVEYGIEISRIHDLGLLAEKLADKVKIPENLYDIFDELTPYGVKVRYPQEILIEKRHVDAAVNDMKAVFEWWETMTSFQSKSLSTNTKEMCFCCQKGNTKR